MYILFLIVLFLALFNLCDLNEVDLNSTCLFYKGSRENPNSSRLDSRQRTERKRQVAMKGLQEIGRSCKKAVGGGWTAGEHLARLVFFFSFIYGLNNLALALTRW